jgi:hypothetical protein
MNISIKQKNGEETILQALTKHFKDYTHNSNGGSCWPTLSAAPMPTTLFHRLGSAQLQDRSGYMRRGPALTHITRYIFPLGNSSLRSPPAETRELVRPTSTDARGERTRESAVIRVIRAGMRSLLYINTPTYAQHAGCTSASVLVFEPTVFLENFGPPVFKPLDHLWASYLSPL